MSSPGRRVAPRAARGRRGGGVPGRPTGSRVLLAGAAVVLLGGLGCLVATLLGLGPRWLELVGAVAVGGVYAGSLAGRVGGRPVPTGLVALLVGTLVALSGQPALRTGAAVLLAVIGGVLGVMLTVPAVRTLRAVREVLVAMVVSSIAAFAAIGLRPVVAIARFEYVTLALALLLTLVLVYRLGAGFHGLGRRGVVVVVVGSLLVALTLVYAELLRRYGTAGMVDAAITAAEWVHARLGALPRPIQVLLGVPALAWGCHMRARRRQGWWVCAFGVAATVPVGHGLLAPAASLQEGLLGQLYGVVLGLVLAYVVIRADLALTGPRGRRARRAEEAAAARPEPPRHRPLR